MATILIHNEENTLLESEQEVASYLENQGVIYEHWDIEKLPNRLSEKYDLTDEEKEEILTVFQKEIQSISEKEGTKRRMSFHCLMPLQILMSCSKTLNVSITIQMMKYALL